MHKAIVTKATGSWYVLKDEQGKRWKARLRGQFKIEGSKATNLITVGDEVAFVAEDEETALITDLHERKNYIIRNATRLSKLYHIIASNVDRVAVVASLSNPTLSLGMIDRLLVTTEAYQIPAVLVLTKSDQWRQSEKKTSRALQSMYEDLNYKTFIISTLNKNSIESLSNYLKGTTTLLAGNSGVGKSSLINALIPGLELKTQDISHWSNKGKHCTTFSEMLFMDKNTALIDSPGIKEFALSDIEKNELCHFFPEMKTRMNDCKFNNCSHIEEKDCAVQMALENNQIEYSRYNSYLSMYYGQEKGSKKISSRHSKY